MSTFIFFGNLVNLVEILALFFTGFYLWRKFKNDFEMKTIGIILALTGLFILIMAIREVFLDFGLINENLAFYIFFIEYIIIVFVILLFIFPRFLYLVSNRPVAKKAGLALGILFYLVYLMIHFEQKDKIVIHYAPIGLTFELPFLEKIFLLTIFAIVLPMMGYKTVIHFFQWRKTKLFPHRFLTYSLLFFFGLCYPVYYFPVFKPWTIIFMRILALGSVLGIYLISSQASIKGEELPEHSKKEEVDELERLRKLTIELKEEVEKLKKELEKKK